MNYHVIELLEVIFGRQGGWGKSDCPGPTAQQLLDAECFINNLIHDLHKKFEEKKEKKD